MANYFSELTSATGLPHFRAQGPIDPKQGCLIGIREGYLTAIGPVTLKNKHMVSLIMRFTSTDAENIRTAIRGSEAVLQALGAKSWKNSYDKQLVVADGYLRFDWAYNFRKPKAEQVAALQQAFAAALRPIAAPLPMRCVLCKNTSVNEISLYDGLPGYYCESCQGITHQEQNAAAAAYEERESNLAGGLLFGLGAAFLGAMAWGLVAYALNTIFLWGPVVIGYLVAKAVFTGMGKVNRAGQALVFILTIGSVLFGDVIYYTLSYMRSEQVAFSVDLLTSVIKSLYAIETSESSGVVTLCFALFGACYVLYTQGRKPKFAARFERLGPAEASKSIAIGAGK